MPRRAASRRRTVVLVGVVVLMIAALAAVVSAPEARSETAEYPLTVSVRAEDGRGRSVDPGRACEAGGNGGVGAYWHYEYGDDLAPGVFSGLGGEVLTHLDIRSDVQDFQNVDGVYPGGTDPTAYLGGVESRASLLNDRGSAKLRLASGTCGEPTLSFDGSTAAGSGTWEVDSGTGAYRDVTGAGTFTMTAEVNPGADNALSLDLNGALTVPTPELEVSVVRTFWGGLGTDYLSRRVSVVYRVANVGDGDAFGVVVTNIENPPESGVRPLVGSGWSAPLPDLPACLDDGSNEDQCSADFTVRHHMNLLTGPCTLLILGCEFDTTLTVDMPDAFDVSHVQSDTVRPRAPDLPPPL